MDWLTFIVEISKAWAWPITAIGLFLLLKKAIPILVERLHSLKYGAFEAKFAEKSATIAESISKASLQLDVAQPESDETKLLHLAQQSPRAAIVETWVQLEQKLLELSNKSHTSEDKMNVGEMVRILHQNKTINTETLKAVEGLRQLRNLAVHAPSKDLSSQKALDFVTLAQAILWTLDNQPKTPSQT